ncbi:MAG TPA: hypothetical protein VEC12_00395, partial [Bacteroidia bacterium]|nr:hypothetical protein [Bacteroidia bacterium]
MKDRESNVMRWSDATSQLGFYIAVLASEYELLKRDNLPTQSTLNELYFAINAIKRLDKTAEVHYAFKLKNDVEVPNENGWFLRDDVDDNFKQNWSSHYLADTRSDFFNIENTKTATHFSPGNEPSQDQLYALLMGFVFVKKYVGHIYADPLNNGTGFYFDTEVANITKRMRDWLLTEKFNRVNEFEGHSTGIFLKQNYTFNNPIYNWEATGGHDTWVFLLAWPTMQVIEHLTGEEVDYTFHCMYNQTNIDINDELTYQELKDHYDDIMAISGDYCIYIGPKEICIKDDNVNMAMRFIMMLEAIGSVINNDIWNEATLDAFGSSRQQPLYPFMARVLSGGTPASDVDEYLKTWLDAMPLCDGCYIYSETDNPNIPLSGYGGNVWSHDNFWINNHVGGGHNWPKIWIKGNQPGLDYMLLYNLYHLQFDNQLNLPQYTPEVICPCKSQKFPEVSNSINGPDFWNRSEIILPEDNQPNLQNTRIIEKYNFDYTQWGINLERYLIKEVNINGGLLDLREDVKVCGDGKTHLNLNGRIKVGNIGTNEPAILRYTAGTLLNIQANGYLEVADNSKVIIEEGAVLRFYNGANIILSGFNSVLEIRGKLELQAGATFQTLGDGYVLFNIKNPAVPNAKGYNIVADPTSQIIFENPTGPKSKKVAVATGTVLFPPPMQMFRFENAGIELQGEGAGIKVDGPYHFQNNSVYGYNGATEKGADGITFYTLAAYPEIKGNNFFYCTRALSFIGTPTTREIKVHYNRFENCKSSVIIYQNSASVAANSFYLSGGVLGGAFVPGHSILLGGYTGRMKIELNKFDNSTMGEIAGASYPIIDVSGNVCKYTASGTVGGYSFSSSNSHNTFKCNWFENQPDALFMCAGSELNLSTLVRGYNPLQNGTIVYGGNNYFKNNERSVVIEEWGKSDPIRIGRYYLNEGQNTFISRGNNTRSSLVVNRPQNIFKVNYSDYSINGDPLNLATTINNNLWSPILPTTNYPAGYPANVIEINQNLSSHFDIREMIDPNYVTGINAVTSSTTCPIPVWNDALADPDNFDPLVIADFGYEFTIGGSNTVYIERPLGYDGNENPTNPVPAGVYNGQPMRTAFNVALDGLVVPTTDEDNN